MDRDTVYTKTAKGLMEATGKTSVLPRDMRAVLKEIDGKATVGEVQDRLRKMPESKLQQTLTVLIRDDFVREFTQKAKTAAPSARAPAAGHYYVDLDFTSPLPTLPTIAKQAQEAARQNAKAAAAEAAVRARAEAEARAKAAAAVIAARAKAEAEARAIADARAKAEAEAQAQRDAQEQARREAEETARKEAEARAEAHEQARIAFEERARVEAELKAALEGERKAREQAERKAKKEAERERKEAGEEARREADELRAELEEERRSREQAERTAKEEAERERKEAEEQGRREADELRAKLEEERRSREQAERRAKEEAERERKQAEEEARREADELRAKLEEERRSREEAERKAKQEAERERKEAEEKARREADELRAKLEEERRSREQAERTAKQEAERERKEAEEEARREADELRARLEEERRAKEEMERVSKEAEESARRETQELRARLEEERKAREAAERETKEQAERKAREDAERSANEQAWRVAREADGRARMEAEDRARAEAERKSREDAERSANEQAERLAREAEERARMQAEDRARAEAERKAREDAERSAREQAERLAREAEERGRRETEEQTRRAAEAEARKQAQDLSRRETEERARRAEQEEREAEDKARKDAEDKTRREAEHDALARSAATSGPSLEDLVRIEADLDVVPGAGAGASHGRAIGSADADDEMQRVVAAKAQMEAEEHARFEAEEKARRAAAAGAERDEAERRTKDNAAQERRPVADRTQEGLVASERELAEVRAWLAAQDEETERHFAEMEKELEAEHAAPGDDGKPAAPLQPPEEARKPDAVEASELARPEAEVRAYEAEPALKQTAVVFRKAINWGKPVALGLFLILILGLVAVHFVSFDGYIPQFEKLAGTHLRQPVKIKALHLSLVPLPHWRLDGVSVGNEGQLEVARINAIAELGSMFSEQKVFKSLELDSPTLSEQGLLALLFGKPQGQDLKVASIIVKNGKLNSKTVILPAVDAKIGMGEDGAWKKIAFETPDHKTSVLLEPKGDAAQFEVETSAFSMPFGPTFILDDFSAKGVFRPGELRLSEFKGGIFGGYLYGNANLKWGDGWTFSGDISARAMDPGAFAPALLEEGKLEGKAVYAMRAKSYDELFAAPRMEGSFSVLKGSLLGVNLARLLQGGGIGGKTAFAELSGSFVSEGGKTQLRQVHLVAGPMSAGGNADADAGKNISGRFAVELKSPVAQARANLAVSGTLREPRFNR
jgi:hypothetical protein